jgi:hypothetical protein
LRAGVSLGLTAAHAERFAAVVGERVGGQAARTWSYRSATPRWSAQEAAVFVADRVVTSRLALEAGLRADGAWAEAEGGGRIEGLVLAPRVSARWSVLARERLVARAAWGRFAHRVPLEWLGHGDPAAPSAQAFRGGTLVAERGPGAPIGSLDQGLRRPRTDEWLLALESRVGPLHVTFAGVDRRGRNLVESVNVGRTAAAYTTVFVPDPGGDIVGPSDDQRLPLFRAATFAGDRLLLTNPDGHDTKFQAVEFTAALRVRDRASLLAGLTAHRSEGQAAYRGFRSSENDPALVGELYDEPNAGTFAYGRLFFDRAYTIKLSGWWRLPGDLRLGAIGRYQDGQPFARLVVDAGAPQGTEIVRAVPNGRHRYEYTLTVDARAEKGFTFGRARVGLIVEGFNLLGNRHVVEEEVTSGAGFRTPTLVQPPRVVRAGLRLDL